MLQAGRHRGLRAKTDQQNGCSQRVVTKGFAGNRQAASNRLKASAPAGDQPTPGRRAGRSTPFGVVLARPGLRFPTPCVECLKNRRQVERSPRQKQRELALFQLARIQTLTRLDQSTQAVVLMIRDDLHVPADEVSHPVRVLRAASVCQPSWASGGLPILQESIQFPLDSRQALIDVSHGLHGKAVSAGHAEQDVVEIRVFSLSSSRSIDCQFEVVICLLSGAHLLTLRSDIMRLRLSTARSDCTSSRPFTVILAPLAGLFHLPACVFRGRNRRPKGGLSLPSARSLPLGGMK